MITTIGHINGFTVTLIEQARSLSELEQTLLVRELNAISIDAFNKETPMEETWERTINVDQIFLINQEDHIVGYTTNDFMQLAGRDVNYFSSALFKRKIQGKGLYKRINELRLAYGKRDIIMTRTQNPLVVKGFKKLCLKNNYAFFPQEENPSKVLEIVQAYSTVDEQLICRGVYGRALMEETPSAKGETRKLFEQIDVHRGDAVILLGKKKQDSHKPPSVKPKLM